MAKQAEAERERRGKVIAAQGELQASETLSEAARVMSINPMALQLRFLQTVTEIAAENNSTTLFPLPLDLFRPFLESTAARAASAAPAQPAALRSGEPLLTLAPAAASERESESSSRPSGRVDSSRTWLMNQPENAHER